MNIGPWNHCEKPYSFVPTEVPDDAESVRASLPNRCRSPETAARLYEEVFEDYRLCDDIGLHIVTFEHHFGINNLRPPALVIAGTVDQWQKRSTSCRWGR